MRNHTAKLNLMKIKKGERFFFYHSNIGKEVVGIGEIIREHYPDPTAEAGSPWVVTDVIAQTPLAKAGDDGRREDRPEAQGHGVAEILAPLGAAGDGGRNGRSCGWAA